MLDESAIGLSATRTQSDGKPDSATPATIHPGLERRKMDRRENPMRPWSGLFGPLRRSQGRRSTDRGHYVDVYTRRDVALLLAIFVLNVGDAFFTMLWLGRGGREANPIMDFLLDIGPGAFIAQKCFVVGFWLLFLMIHKNFRIARIGLYTALTVYSLLMVLHFGIIALDITPHRDDFDADAMAHEQMILSGHAPAKIDSGTLLDDEPASNSTSLRPATIDDRGQGTGNDQGVGRNGEEED
jgi:hypothetical protein